MNILTHGCNLDENIILIEKKDAPWSDRAVSAVYMDFTPVVKMFDHGLELDNLKKSDISKILIEVMFLVTEYDTELHETLNFLDEIFMSLNVSEMSVRGINQKVNIKFISALKHFYLEHLSRYDKYERIFGGFVNLESTTNYQARVLIYEKDTYGDSNSRDICPDIRRCG